MGMPPLEVEVPIDEGGEADIPVGAATSAAVVVTRRRPGAGARQGPGLLAGRVLARPRRLLRRVRRGAAAPRPDPARRVFAAGRAEPGTPPRRRRPRPRPAVAPGARRPGLAGGVADRRGHRRDRRRRCSAPASATSGAATETIIMAGIDVLLAFPALVLLLVVLAYVGRSLTVISLLIGFLSIPVYTRVARANTLAVAQREFVAAAEVLGASRVRILLARDPAQRRPVARGVRAGGDGPGHRAGGLARRVGPQRRATRPHLGRDDRRGAPPHERGAPHGAGAGRRHVPHRAVAQLRGRHAAPRTSTPGTPTCEPRGTTHRCSRSPTCGRPSTRPAACCGRSTACPCGWRRARPTASSASRARARPCWPARCSTSSPPARRRRPAACGCAGRELLTLTPRQMRDVSGPRRRWSSRTR